jgi:hypothetical protein
MDSTGTKHPGSKNRRSCGGSAVVLWLVAITLAEYLLICRALLHAYSV